MRSAANGSEAGTCLRQTAARRAQKQRQQYQNYLPDPLQPPHTLSLPGATIVRRQHATLYRLIAQSSEETQQILSDDARCAILPVA